MRIARFRATRVHGYLDFDLTFNDDLTFLIGINGSGKTSVLRLIQGLLVPSFRLLSDIRFDAVHVCCQDQGDSVGITATTKDDAVELAVDGIADPLRFPVYPPREFSDHPVDREDSLETSYREFQDHEVIQRIRSLNTPMFLGLERRSLSEASQPREAWIRYRRLGLLRTGRISSGTLTASLGEVQALAIDYIRHLRARKDRLGEELRRSIILSAFDYQSQDVSRKGSKLSEDYVQKLRIRREEILGAAESLGLEAKVLEEKLRPFVERMSQLALHLRQNADDEERLVEWELNRAQMDRLDDLLARIEEYQSRVTQIFTPIDNLQRAVGLFLHDTGKKLVVTPDGDLAIQLESDEERAIDALSSGERQILVILAHLIFRQRDEPEGVFIVDEPELSLHLKWQEQFVEAVQTAAPKMQIILATHSPSIVLDRESKCIDLGDR